MKYFSRVCFALIIVLVIIVNVLRFVGLEQTPPGFHVDEIATGVNLSCLATEQVTGRGMKGVLFSDMHFGTPKPPTHVFPGVLWVKIFGYSIPSLRSISGAVMLLTILGLFFLSRQFLDVKFGLLTVLVATISPWSWIFSRIAYESTMAPLFIVWGYFFFFRSNKVIDLILSGMIFSCAMYAYPPTRAQIPVLLICAILLKYKKHGIKKGSIAAFLFTLVLVSIPLIKMTLSGALMGRFNQIGIFSHEYFVSIGKEGTLLDIIFLFGKNFAMHFHPTFLFFSGDRNLVHSTQMVGQLSWVDIFSLMGGIIIFIVLVFRRGFLKGAKSSEGFVVLFCLINILIGIFPSALTWEGIPHALRSFGAWPFVMILSGYCLWKLFHYCSYSLVVVILLAGLFSNYYLGDYFTKYSKRSYFMFASWSKDMAKNAKTSDDWLKFMYVHRGQDLTVRYFLMNYQGLGCTQSQQVWDNFRENLQMRGIE